MKDNSLFAIICQHILYIDDSQATLQDEITFNFKKINKAVIRLLQDKKYYGSKNVVKPQNCQFWDLGVKIKNKYFVSIYIEK